MRCVHMLDGIFKNKDSETLDALIPLQSDQIWSRGNYTKFINSIMKCRGTRFENIWKNKKTKKKKNIDFVTDVIWAHWPCLAHECPW